MVPGNSNLSVGQVIDLDMLELAGFTEEKLQEKKISGKHVITRVTHLIGHTRSYHMIMGTRDK